MKKKRFIEEAVLDKDNPYSGGDTMRRVVLLGLLAVALGTGLLTGLRGNSSVLNVGLPQVCVGCDPTNTFILVQTCEWDWGCFFNPFEPDGQWWCQLFQVYVCPGGVRCLEPLDPFECGPCCDPNNPGSPPIPVPAPVPVPIPSGS